jgi:uncharacterized protein YydD (DUF2326 family)
MRYRQFTGQLNSLKQRIAEVENRHYNRSVDLKVAEATNNDAVILAATEDIQECEKTLALLHGLLPQ